MLEFVPTLHYYNDSISSIIGVCANLLAIYIVKKRTSITLRQYSQTLLQNCVIDLTFNIVIFITKETFDITNGFYYVLSTGFVSKVNHPWDQIFHYLYYFASFFCDVSMIIPFYCRYRVFCKNKIFNFYQILFIYLSVSLTALAHVFFFALALSPASAITRQAEINFKNSIFANRVDGIPAFLATSETYPFFIIAASYLTFSTTLVYSLMIFLGVRLHRYLGENKTKMLPSVYNYQNEINKVLYLQAIVPVIAGSLTVMGAVFIFLFSINISGLLTLFMLPFSWVCVVNPLIAIFMVRIYRKAVIHPRKYLWAKSLNKASTSITMIK